MARLANSVHILEEAVKSGGDGSLGKTRVQVGHMHTFPAEARPILLASYICPTEWCRQKASPSGPAYMSDMCQLCMRPLPRRQAGSITLAKSRLVRQVKERTILGPVRPSTSLFPTLSSNMDLNLPGSYISIEKTARETPSDFALKTGVGSLPENPSD